MIKDIFATEWINNLIHKEGKEAIKLFVRYEIEKSIRSIPSWTIGLIACDTPFVILVTPDFHRWRLLPEDAKALANSLWDRAEEAEK